MLLLVMEITAENETNSTPESFWTLTDELSHKLLLDFLKLDDKFSVVVKFHI